MIDLKNTKIDCRKEDGTINNELNRLYRDECAKQGILEKQTNGVLDSAYFLMSHSNFNIKGNNQLEWLGRDGLNYFLNLGLKQITLSDLKPKRTKTEYVKVCSFREAIALMIDSETLYSESRDGHLLFNGSHFINHNGLAIDINCISEKDFYRKVEREIIWQEEAKQFFAEHRGTDLEAFINFYNSNGDTALQSEFIKLCHLVASMTDNPKKEG